MLGVSLFVYMLLKGVHKMATPRPLLLLRRLLEEKGTLVYFSPSLSLSRSLKKLELVQ